MKKITSVCLIFFIVLTFFTGTALAEWPAYTGSIKDAVKVILIDADTGRELFSQNKDEQIEPASTTKIMTCILALENSKMDDEVTISKKAASSRLGSTLGIKTGEKIKMQDLLTGMMLKSGNDAAVAVAEKVSGSVTDFATLMNEKAQSLGMASTNFVNPNGLHNDDHYSTASDMAKLARYAMQNQTFRDIVQLTEYQMPKTNKQSSRKAKNTNDLLLSNSKYYYSYATGVKTGSTTSAGGCLVASATKDNKNLLCLIYNDRTSKRTDRWGIAKKLFEWGFETFKAVDISALLGPPVEAQVQDYAADDSKDGLLQFKQPDAGTTNVTLPQNIAQGLTDGTDTLEAVTSFDKEQITAPVSEGDILGTVIYKSKATGDEVFSYPLVASRDILEEKSSDVISPVITLPPTPPVEVVPPPDYTLLFVALIVIAGGLIAFLIVRMVMARRRRHFSKRRKPHYSYRR